MTRKISNHVLGIILLSLVVIIWVGSSVLIQFIFKDENYKKPLFLTYFNTSLFCIYLCGFLLPSWRSDSIKGRERQRLLTVSTDNAIDNMSANEDNVQNSTLSEEESAEFSDSDASDSSISVKQLIRVALIICPMWFFANYFFNLGLGLTTVSSSTVLSSTSGLFTLLFGVLWRIEKFAPSKLLSVLVCVGGVFMVSFSDGRRSGEESILGDAASLAGSIVYGLYSVFLKRKLESDTKVKSTMFFGILGAVNVVCLWPLLFFLHIFGWEIFEFPSPHVFGYLVLNGLVGTVLSDLLWLRAVLLTSPLIATVGISLTIPLAMGSDILIRHVGIGFAKPLYLIGSLLVLFGFIGVNLKPDGHEWLKVFNSWFSRSVVSAQDSMVVSDNASVEGEPAHAEL